MFIANNINNRKFTCYLLDSKLLVKYTKIKVIYYKLSFFCISSLFLLIFSLILITSIVSAESKTPTLILNVNVVDDIKQVFPNENIILLSEVFNIGEMRNFDIFLYYYIYDSNGNKVFEEHETGAIETRASFVKKIKSPLNPGNYTGEVKVYYLKEKSANKSFDFEVIDKSKSVSPVIGASVTEQEIKPNASVFGMVFFMILSLILIVYIIVDKKINKKKNNP